jgi:hypothetical protein
VPATVDLRGDAFEIKSLCSGANLSYHRIVRGASAPGRDVGLALA